MVSQLTLQLFGPDSAGESLVVQPGPDGFWFPNAALSASTQSVHAQFLPPPNYALFVAAWRPASLDARMRVVAMLNGPTLITELARVSPSSVEGPVVSWAVVTDPLAAFWLQHRERFHLGYQLNAGAVLYTVRVEMSWTEVPA